MRLMFAILLLAATAAGAQEGFPLDGTWRGERPGADKTPVTLVMVLEWDGKKEAGVINPGPDGIPISEATLIPEGWKVKVAGRSPKGAEVTFDGVIGDLGKYNRTITGTWTEGGHSYPVKMVRE